MPLLVRWPNGLPAGRVDAGLASLTDLAPTILRAAGLQPPPEMDEGRDLLPQWRGERVVRDAVTAEFVDNPGTLDLTTRITADRKITVYRGGAYAGREDEVGELYDLEADPGEVRNLWLDPDRSSERLALEAQLAPLKRRTPRAAPRLAYA